MKKLKLKIEIWLKSLMKQVIDDSLIEKRVGEAIEKLRYDYLPHGACWMCSMPVSRKGGYSMYKGRMFCGKNCLDKYESLIQKPDENYKLINGEPVEVFKPK